MDDKPGRETYEDGPDFGPLARLFEDPDDPNSLESSIRLAADQFTGRSLDTFVNETDQRVVAGEILTGAGMLVAMQYSIRAGQLLGLFDSLGLIEDEETADLFAAHRHIRLMLALREGNGQFSPLAEVVIEEQETSCVQTSASSRNMYAWAAMHGHASSFKKWFSEVFGHLQPPSPDVTNSANDYWHARMTLGDILRSITCEGVSAQDPTSLDATLTAFFQVIDESVAASGNKIEFIHNIDSILSSWAWDNSEYLPDMSRRVSELRRKYIKEVVGSFDRSTQGRITDSPQYKRFIRALLSPKTDIPRAPELIAEWEAEGLFDEFDLARINRWREEFTPKVKKRRKRARQRDR